MCSPAPEEAHHAPSITFQRTTHFPPAFRDTGRSQVVVGDSGEGPAAALGGPPPLFQWEIVVNDLNDDRNEFFGLDPDYWSPVPLGKMTYTWSDTVLEDIAFCPWEDVSVDGTLGFYGVGYSGLSGVDTSYLYHFTIDPATPQQDPFPIVPDLEMIILSEPKSGATPGNPNDDRPVRLDAAEFDDRGMLHVAGHYDYDPADEPHTNLFEDWVFTIDVTGINPTDHHVVANPLQQLKVGTQQYHSAGDLDFDYYNKDLYVTTNEQKLLVVFMPRPQTPAIAARSGDLGHDDFQGMALDPPQVMWSFRKRPDSDGVRRVYQLHLGYGTSDTRDPIGDHPNLDDIMGAASIKTTAKADLCGAYFDVPPGPVNAGSCLTTSFTVQNTGGKHAGPFNVRFYLSTDATITSSDYELAPLEEYPWHCENGLQVRQTTSGPVTLCLPGAKDPFWQGSGMYYIGMIVDADDDVFELDENNNSNTGKGLDYDDFSVTVPAVAVTLMPAPSRRATV